MALLSSLSKPLAQQTGVPVNHPSKNNDLLQNFQLVLTGAVNQQSASNVPKLQQLITELKQLLQQIGMPSSSVASGTGPIRVEQVIAAIEKISDGQMKEILPEEIKELLHATRDDLRQLSNHEQNNLIEKLKELLERDDSADHPAVTMIHAQAIPMLEAVEQTGQKDNVSLHAAQSKQLTDLWNRFEQIRNKLNSQIPLSQSVKPEQLDPSLMIKLKQVLQQLAALEAGSSQKDVFHRTLNRLSDQSTGQQQLLTNLLNNFTRKQSIPAPYQQQTSVTSKDVARWLTPLLHKQQTAESVQGQGFTQMMSKVEQYVIHVNPNQSSQGMQKQLLNQFEQLMQSNRVFLNNAGNMEMNIRLKPQQLGDMTVRLLQLNGEMTVKILVSTVAAKEMLDGNIQQLRHMFSPQQVVIEKHDPSAAGPLPGDEEQQSSESNERDSSDQSQDQQQNERSEEEVSFHELLMNEKV
ncbi:flagellar hook-length control protein FliK [Halobacillus naozhouensis]|uniref:Flagellar hook-length control protein FliK n=1 Tax=Halobacillus naozhouensis TaxID=554880 RepID=A0ABY8J4F8_9BACI|nr:flagellar hook-length control protein FliK [Halobacillus naozhouensis]WFT76951.1 flagellar hook-length control protein FliK [Halobacillus naozhouensis]